MVTQEKTIDSPSTDDSHDMLAVDANPLIVTQRGRVQGNTHQAIESLGPGTYCVKLRVDRGLTECERANEGRTDPRTVSQAFMGHFCQCTSCRAFFRTPY